MQLMHSTRGTATGLELVPTEELEVVAALLDLEFSQPKSTTGEILVLASRE